MKKKICQIAQNEVDSSYDFVIQFCYLVHSLCIFYVKSYKILSVDAAATVSCDCVLRSEHSFGVIDYPRKRQDMYRM